MYSRLKLNNLTLWSLSKKLIEGKSLKWWHVCKPLVPCSQKKKSHQGFRQAALSIWILHKNIRDVEQLLVFDIREKLLKCVYFASLCLIQFGICALHDFCLMVDSSFLVQSYTPIHIHTYTYIFIHTHRTNRVDGQKFLARTLLFLCCSCLKHMFNILLDLKT